MKKDSKRAENKVVIEALLRQIKKKKYLCNIKTGDHEKCYSDNGAGLPDGKGRRGTNRAIRQGGPDSDGGCLRRGNDGCLSAGNGGDSSTAEGKLRAVLRSGH